MATATDQLTPNIKEQDITPELQVRLDKVINNIIVKDPVFGIFFSLFKLKSTNSLPTLATDCDDLWFNPAFIKNLDDQQLAAVLYHEVYHCLGETAGEDHRLTSFEDRGDDRYPITKRMTKASRQQIGNMASDYQINADVVKGGGKLPPDVLYKEEWKDLSLDEILNLLLKTLPPKLPSVGIGDLHRGSDKLPSKEDTINKWGKINDQLSSIGGSEYSTSPLGEFARKIRDSKYEPKLDWANVLSETIRKKCGPTKYTYNRPSRRFVSSGIYMPARVKEKVPCEVIVGVDVSGSMSDEDIIAAFKEIDHITDRYSRAEKEISFESTKMDGPYKVKGKFADHPLEPKSTGGTYLYPFFEHYGKAPNPQDKILIMFSDLYIDPEDAQNIRNIVQKKGIKDVYWITNRKVESKDVPVGQAMEYHPIA
jgi:predicted metal-dependent peptidase